MDNLTGKAVLLYMAGYSPRAISRVLGGEAYPRLSSYLKAMVDEKRGEMMTRIADAVVESNKEFIGKVKAAEWEVYEQMATSLKQVTQTHFLGMAPKDKYLHVKTMLGAQKFVYNTMGVKTATDQNAPSKLVQVNVNQFRTDY